MCGIMGYVGRRPIAKEVVLSGLKALEYRGYDSAGLAVLEDGRLRVAKRAGKLDELIREVGPQASCAATALGHTRWATHGRVTDENAHPHCDCKNTIAVIHNGIIENYLSFKKSLMAEGHEFASQTDTEVLAHLFERHYNGNLEEAVRKGLQGVKGAFALAVVCEQSPHEIVVAKTASPLVIGLGTDGNYLASGVPALLPYTRRTIFLNDGELAVIRSDSVKITDFEGRELQRDPVVIDWDPVTAQKQGYKHFMLKEIHEQPQAVANTLRGRVDLEAGEIYLADLRLSDEHIRRVENVTLIACGTAWHACWTAKYLWQRYLDLPIGVEIASEFRYSHPHLSQKTLVIAVSQSGETADTLAGVRLAKEKGASLLAITNSPGSAISREADWTLYTQAGPEIGVASTKCFLAQLVALALLGLYFGRHRGTLTTTDLRTGVEQLVAAPGLLERVLKAEGQLEALAQRFYDKPNFLYLGRDILCPIAYEGALKLKEISYIHAEGYAAGEMKHGPIALIDENMPVVVLVTQNSVYDKVFSNIEEVKARKGIVLALSDERNRDLDRIADHVIEIPLTAPITTPMLFTVPLQLFAYHVAVLRGTDVDQPRNLAKSVTVE
jgi:glucosamine--fructose-6-phosphate aminotransferase (isomerizing)